MIEVTYAEVQYIIVRKNGLAGWEVAPPYSRTLDAHAGIQ
jgi:hypothetical protein